MADELEQTMLARLKAQVERKILPDQAGQMTPATMRAASAIRKTYPADMAGVKVNEQSMLDPYAFSSILASTPSRATEILRQQFKEMKQPDYESFEVNPAVSALYPQNALEKTMAHELEHIRQNRTEDPLEALRQHVKLAYNDRPIEKSAREAADKYKTMTPNDGAWTGQGLFMGEMGKLLRGKK